MNPVTSYYPTSPTSVLSLFHLRVDLPSGLFPSGFLTKMLYAYFISPVSTT